MKMVELKNCPNCNERIGIQDVECPYCKYIDDPKYKKYNNNLKKKKGKKNNNKKVNIYKLLLFIPIVTYLIYLLFDFNLLFIIISLILLNVMCFFVKKNWIFGLIIIEFIALTFKFVNSIYDMFLVNSFEKLKLEIIIFILGILFIIIPKLTYVLKSKKKVKKGRKK